MNPIFNCCNNLLWSWVYKVTTGTYNFTFVIKNVALIGALIAHGLPCASEARVVVSVITQFLDHASIKSTSHLIKCISNVLEKLHKYLKGTAISTFTVLLLLSS